MSAENQNRGPPRFRRRRGSRGGNFKWSSSRGLFAIALLVAIPFLRLQLALLLETFKPSQDGFYGLLPGGLMTSFAEPLVKIQRVDKGGDKNTMVFVARGQRYRKKTTKPILAILVATRSLETWEYDQSTPLQQYLLPSLQQNVTREEIQKWDIRLYVAIDHDDKFWVDKTRWMNLRIPHYLQVHVHIFPSTLHRIPFNEIATVAYKDGAEYFCRINDDTSFTSRHWIDHAVATLRNFTPPNVGVVGPSCDQGNAEILTHDFVHKTHMEIFDGYYYPQEFRNWYVDDWMTGIYSRHVLGKNFTRVVKLENWTVVHHLSPPRYQSRSTDSQYLPKLYTDGLEQVRTYLKKHYPKQASLLKKKLTNPRDAELPDDAQIGPEQAQAILKVLPKNGKMLVWGLGHDSIYWYTVTEGKVVFLQDNDSAKWEGGHEMFLEIMKLHPFMEAEKVNYTTHVVDSWKKFHGHANRWENKLLMNLPDKVWNRNWNVILVDAPLGYEDQGPGRYQSIYTTYRVVQKQLARHQGQDETVHVFIDDYNRKVEGEFSREVFGMEPVEIVHREPRANQKEGVDLAHFVFDQYSIKRSPASGGSRGWGLLKFLFG